MNRLVHCTQRRVLPILAGVFAALASPAALAAPFTLVASPMPREARQLHAPLTRGPDGLAYGMGWYGGTARAGSIYRIEADGTFTVLHDFGSGASDGTDAPCGLLVGADGWLYGMTQHGGTGHRGTLFKISTAGEYVVLHDFGAGSNQGAGYPSGPLVQDDKGNLYGTLGGGGALAPFGAVFRMNAAGAFDLMHVFADDGDGAYPDALVFGRNGVLYGTSAYTHGALGGTLFTVGADGKFTVLHTFDCNADGCQPYGRLVVDADGVLFGAAPLGGLNGGVGTVYRWKHGAFDVLYALGGNDHLGSIPQGGLEIDEHGRLYTTTEFDGDRGGGVLFELRRNGTTKVLHDFSQDDGANGYFPVSAPTLFPGGQLWGTTLSGGNGDAGVVFRVQLPQ